MPEELAPDLRKCYSQFEVPLNDSEPEENLILFNRRRSKGSGAPKAFERRMVQPTKGYGSRPKSSPHNPEGNMIGPKDPSEEQGDFDAYGPRGEPRPLTVFPSGWKSTSAKKSWRIWRNPFSA